jgi:hypothetical protein
MAGRVKKPMIDTGHKTGVELYVFEGEWRKNNNNY